MFSAARCGSHPPGSRKTRCTSSAAPPGHNTHNKQTSSKTHHLQHPDPPATTQTPEPANEQNQTSQTKILGTQPPQRGNTERTPPPPRTHERTNERKNETTKRRIQTSGTQPPLMDIAQMIEGASLCGEGDDEDEGGNGEDEVEAQQKQKRT